MTPQDRTHKIALVVLVAISGLSVFLIVVGLPSSYGSVSESCSVGNPCIETQQSGTNFDRVPVATVPLLAALIVGVGLVKNRILACWAGLIGLLAFSFVSLFSVGLLYFPFAVALVAPISIIQSRKGNIIVSA